MASSALSLDAGQNFRFLGTATLISSTVNTSFMRIHAWRRAAGVDAVDQWI
jgi:hypothetical protein